MTCLLILLFASTAFGAEYEKFLTEDSIVIARINAEEPVENPYWLTLTPIWIDPEFAFADPNIGERTDLSLAITAKWENTTYRLNPEQADGIRYFNQRYDHFKKGRFIEKGLTIINKSSRSINTQILYQHMRLWKYGIGFKFRTDQWDIKQRKWYFDQRFTLIESDDNKESVYLNYSTDFGTSKAWDINVDYWCVSARYYRSETEETYHFSLKGRIPFRKLLTDLIKLPGSE